MQGPFLDTNIFIRHLVNDVPVRSAACRELFRAIERQELTAWTTPLVIAEVVFVLSNARTYDVDRPALRDRLLPLISLPNLKVERKQLYPRIFDLYVNHPIDYVDAYHAALLERGPDLVLFSYDADFDLLPNLQRREP
jgi:predicted nucleic acid-binding protein